MRIFDVISLVLLTIGGLNWGLWGLFEFDLVAAIFGGTATILAKLVYDLVGLAGLYMIFAAWSLRQRWHVPRNIEVIDRAA